MIAIPDHPPPPPTPPSVQAAFPRIRFQVPVCAAAAARLGNIQRSKSVSITAGVDGPRLPIASMAPAQSSVRVLAERQSAAPASAVLSLPSATTEPFTTCASASFNASVNAARSGFPAARPRGGHFAQRIGCCDPDAASLSLTVSAPLDALCRAPRGQRSNRERPHARFASLHAAISPQRPDLEPALPHRPANPAGRANARAAASVRACRNP